MPSALSIKGCPPCTQPLSDLKPIFIRDLMFNTHHRGRVLVVKTFCEPNAFTTCSILNAIEDGNGDVDRVDLRYIAFVESPERIMPKNAILAIKEPYYKSAFDGGTLVRVDQPSNLILLKPGNDLVPRSWMPDTSAHTSLTAAQLKEKGNTAFRRHDWKEAADCYSEALALANLVTNIQHTVQDDMKPQGIEASPTTLKEVVPGRDDDLCRTLHRNRAQARLNLGQYEFAADDALAALIPGEDLSEEASSLNSKALFRAGLASYELGYFRLAHGYFKQARHLSVDDKSTLLERTERRLREQDHGMFDFNAMGKSVTPGHTRLDHASFLGNTRIAPAGDRGRGLFATKDLAPGDVILVEKAFYVASKNDAGGNAGAIPYNTGAKRLNGIMEKLRWNPHQAVKYMGLFDGGTFENKVAKMVDGMVVVDIFQVQAIARLNGFGCKSSQWKARQGENDSNEALGVWLRASLSNHSCLPNATRTFIGDMMIVHANRNIQAGDEIFMTYYPDRDPYAERKKVLGFYKIDCDCALCVADQAMPESILEKRYQLYKQVELFIDANQPSSTSSLPPASKIKEAKELLEQLESTYDKKMFERLPRAGCALLDTWLCRSQSIPATGLVLALRLLRDLGYFVTIKDGDVAIDRSNSIVALAGVHGAMYACSASSATGNYAVAAAFKKFAKELYVIIHAELAGFEEFC